MSFSQSGDLLATVGIDQRHQIAIYDLKIGSMICHAEGGVNFIAEVAF